MSGPVRYTVTFDAVDPAALAAWWAETLGWVVVQARDDIAVIAPAAGDRPEGDDEHILFFKVPESKAAKNRCHLDLHPPEDGDGYMAGLESRGAVRVSLQGEGWPVRWAVLQDPEGNEFCVVLGAQAGSNS